MSTANRPPARILVADDQEGGRIALSAYLEEEGYDVVCAIDGEQALDAASSSRPDLVITDVLMPRMDGLELCRRLRSRPGLRDVPIIIVTALDEREDKIRGLEAGCDDFLAKPFDREELIARVDSLLRLNWYRSRLAETEWFENVLNNARDGVLVADAQWRLTHCNPAARLLLGLSPAFAGRGLLDHLCSAFELNRDRDALVGDAPGAVEIDARRAATDDAPALWLNLRGDWVVGPDGEPDSLVLTVRDVTAEREEEKLRWDFLSLVSHKVRTPITVILEYASLFTEGFYGEISEDQAEGIRALAKGARDLGDIFAKILEFLEAERLTGERRTFDPGAVVAELVADLRDHYPDLRIDEATAPVEALRVYGAGSVFRVIAWNLLENAAKFGPTDALRLRCEVGVHGNRLRLSVADEGRGIPSEQIDRVVEPFYQFERDFTGSVPGMGLGLAVIARMVDSLGGGMEVHSTLGHGTRVTVELPVRVPSTIAAKAAAGTDPTTADLAGDGDVGASASPPAVAATAPSGS